MRALLTALSLLAGLVALPATALAVDCELTTAVSPAHQITITGSGFPATTGVDITTTWSGSSATAGGNTGPQTTTSRETTDASGTFTFTIDAGPGHGGTYDVEATAGGCTATTQVAALETAGGINTGGTAGAGGANATPPATDTEPLPGRGSGVPLAPIVPVLLGLGLGLITAAWMLRRAQQR